MTCSQCGLGPERAHGRFVCAYRRMQRTPDFARMNKKTFSRLCLFDVLQRVAPFSDLNAHVDTKLDVERFAWWCVRNAWRFGPRAKFMGDQCKMNARRAREAIAPLWEAQEPVLRDVNRYAADRYARACAEILGVR